MAYNGNMLIPNVVRIGPLVGCWKGHMDTWAVSVKMRDLRCGACFQADVSADVAYVMAPKEEPELLVMKKACSVSVDVFKKYLKDQIMEIIDSDKVSIFQSSHFHLLVEHHVFYP